jgi:hypothetical protein
MLAFGSIAAHISELCHLPFYVEFTLFHDGLQRTLCSPGTFIAFQGCFKFNLVFMKANRSRQIFEDVDSSCRWGDLGLVVCYKQLLR